ncbi:MAG TPA: tRNA pseudouridine(55) synthase TruB [Myxococcales bacterium]|nr:tRNA pseudouridine(55) synthase TruB [Myxococcales bacterium]
MGPLEPGIHLLHKPRGATSFSLVQPFLSEARGRNRLPVCHGGALDPFAHGLMLLLAGRATRLFETLHEIAKEYEAEVAWGAETDNGDPLGRVIARGDATVVDPHKLDEVLPSFLGWREQVPPATSNKRIDGERAYARAQRGEAVQLPPARVYLHEARWIAHDLPRASRLRLVVRGGYYVRALARDLGRALGCRAHLESLWRSAIGPWRDPGPGTEATIRGSALLPWLRKRELDEKEAAALRRGGSIGVGTLAAAEWQLPTGFPEPQPLVRALLGGHLVALLRQGGDRLTREIELGRL